MLEIYLLGQFLVQHDREVIEIASRPAQELLAYLLLNSHISYRREKLAGLLWPDSDETNARTYLRQVLWRLRKLVGDEYFLADQLSIGFNPDADYTLDVDTLTDEALKEGSSDELIRAVSVYKGHLLPGFYTDWGMLERERLQHIYADRTARLLTKLSDEKRWHETLEWGERWVSFGQTPEPAYRALMAAHANLGDMAAMAAAYRRCVDALKTDLGVDPSPETQQLYKQLVNGVTPSSAAAEKEQRAPSTGQTIAPKPPPLFLDTSQAEATPPVFVARTEALERLNSLLESMLSGAGQVLFITGDAGQGKTALVNAFARQAMESHPDLQIVKGNCSVYSGLGDSYLPFRDVLRMLAGEVDTYWRTGSISSSHARQLWQLTPFTIDVILRHGPDLINTFIPGELLKQRLADHPNKAEELQEIIATASRKGKADEIEQSGYLFEQYTQVLQVFSRSSPLIIILEDLHWADLASISLLFHLGQRIQSTRIMLLGTYRSAEIALGRGEQRHPLNQVINEFKRQFGDLILDLNEISHKENQAFLLAYLETMPNILDASFHQTLLRKTNGHPLFTIELLREMQARGDLVQDRDGKWMETASLEWERLPLRVEGVIAERVERLDNRLSEILHIASVAGEEFAVQTIAAVLDTDEWQLHRQISQELVQHHCLLRPLGEKRVNGRYLSMFQFIHDMFRHYLYNELSAGERRILHGKVAAVLENQYTGADEEIAPRLAYHYDEARNPNRAVHYLLLAGEQAHRKYAHHDALHHLDRALELIPADDLQSRYQALLNKERIYAVLGDSASRQSTLEALRLLAEKLDNPNRQAEVALRFAKYHEVSGDFSTSIQQAKQATKLSRESTLKAGGYLQWGRSLMRGGNYQDTRKRLTQALNLAQMSGQARIEARCLRNIGLLLINLGEPEAARKRLSEAIPKFRESDDLIGEAHAIHNLASTYLLEGRLESAHQHFQRALKMRQRIGDRLGQGDVFISLGMVAYLRGRYMESRGQTKQALAIMRKINYRRGEAVALSSLGYNYLREGKYEKAKNCLRDALQIFQALDHRQGEQIIQTGLGLLFFHLGMYPLAGEYFEQASKAYKENSYRWGEMDELTGMSMVQRAQGHNSAAIKSSQYSLKNAKKTGDIYAQAYALTHLGHALTASGKFSRAAACYQEAVGLREHAGQRHMTIEPLAGLAHIHLLEGQKELALNPVEKIIQRLADEQGRCGDEIGQIYLICYQVLLANKDPRALEVLEAGQALIQSRSEIISNTREKHAYLENIPAHKQIADEINGLEP